MIIDCGANVGYSTAYFLSRFPTCKVIAIEPDPENFRVLEQNLAPYREQIRLLRSAVWSHATGLVISEIPYRDGRGWTKQVRECQPNGKPSILAVDMGTVLQESGLERISILKMDVEGSESVIFGKEYESWIDKVDNIAIELHDDSTFGDCSKVFFKAISNRQFEISQSGELTVCKS